MIPEKEREALMRLTMCARIECDICIYKGDSIEKCDERITKNMNILADALRADRKDEPTCDTCRHKGVEGCEQPCLGCGCCGLYEAMTGNDKLKEKVVEFIKSCTRCKHRPIGAMMCEESCHYEPKDEPQTGRSE